MTVEMIEIAFFGIAILAYLSGLTGASPLWKQECHLWKPGFHP